VRDDPRVTRSGAPVRLSDLVATLSLVSDLGMGRPMERVLRQTVIALRLADAAGLGDPVRSAAYYTSLLTWVGCAADTSELAELFGDEMPTLMFLTKEAVRLATDGVAVGTACAGCPDIPSLMARLAAAGGTLLVCPICVNAKGIDPDTFLPNASLGGTVQLWEWIGPDAASCFSY
jgi:hypothetical protein